MKVLLTGGSGQLGRQLRRTAPDRLGGESLELITPGREELDLEDPECCRKAVLRHRPDWLINAGAWTAVDLAEREPERVHRINAEAPSVMAEALQQQRGRLLQVSTDFVFSGRQGTPYRPDQSPEPLGVYGASKAAAEREVRRRLSAGRAFVLRTSWLHGPEGRNFVTTMLRLQRERAGRGQALRVVADQVGSPTGTATVARACWRILEQAGDPTRPPLPGVLHACDAGVASWYDLAVAVAELAREAGMLERTAPVLPIRTADYPTPAERPPYSVLDGLGSLEALELEPRHWRLGVADTLAGIVAAQTSSRSQSR
jgi:dTDP-4-dehydrorhamnose reductase